MKAAPAAAAKPAAAKKLGAAKTGALKNGAAQPAADAKTAAVKPAGAAKSAPRERAAKPKSTSGRAAAGKVVAKGGALKIVWIIYDTDHRTKATFPYPQKPQADKQAAALSQSTGRPHTVKGIKVPM